MRIKVELISKTKNIYLKTGYNASLQALIYNNISKKLADRLHDEGFMFEKRKFKLFTYSSILEFGKFDKEKRIFKFPQQISFYISSPVDFLLEDIGRTLINQDEVRLGNNILLISSINIIKKILPEKNSLKITATTPIEMHSTFKKGDGKNFTHYYTPFEEDFSRLIRENLLKKWIAFNNRTGFSVLPDKGENTERSRSVRGFEKAEDITFSIKPLFKNKNNEKIIYFGSGEKKTLIKGWKGYFIIESNSSELLHFALDVGLGGRNSQGFGMINLVK